MQIRTKTHVTVNWIGDKEQIWDLWFSCLYMSSATLQTPKQTETHTNRLPRWISIF